MMMEITKEQKKEAILEDFGVYRKNRPKGMR